MLDQRRLLTSSILIFPVLSAVLLIVARPLQAQTETVLYNFSKRSDGRHPYPNLTSDGAGNFYGTTFDGGANGSGTVFELSPNGVGGWNETVLYSFCSVGNCLDGSYPLSNVILDSGGNLYGTTSLGGAFGGGVVFELSPVGGWTETVLYSLVPPNGRPHSSLIMDKAGNLYGVTLVSELGGEACSGVVFELSPSGGQWNLYPIYGCGTRQGGLTIDAAGNIYVVRANRVLELSPNGNGGWNSRVIHVFDGPKDGRAAVGALALDQAGRLYGTTYAGGAKNLGTVYMLSPGKGKEKGTWKERVLYSFKGYPNDGGGPRAGVAFNGNIYGTTASGGTYGYGTVFRIDKVTQIGGKTYYREQVLWSFNGTDGSHPHDSLTLDGAGNLYGTTVYGGSNGYGVAFEVTP
jgi:uncharacterized repeat protein (TIGR03803 family)